MEPYIQISFLNDFIFCPRSIYFHQLYSGFKDTIYKQTPQIAGETAHTSIEEKKYSTQKYVLQGIEIFSEQYNLCGKIDVFDSKTGRLTERKREIKTIYDGYVFQVYAQCHALREMGFEVKEIIIHDLVHNKNFPVPLPENDPVMQQKFENLVQQINDFDLLKTDFVPNKQKCENCIYNQLCDYSLC
ncbi:MAG: type V CRISPR-associated protein Cas4 [Bacteroidia bacterium]|nr:type V CRISPR-associated protein Cas4 [Bacteroidia bacterium]